MFTMTAPGSGQPLPNADLHIDRDTAESLADVLKSALGTGGQAQVRFVSSHAPNDATSVLNTTIAE